MKDNLTNQKYTGTNEQLIYMLTEDIVNNMESYLPEQSIKIKEFTEKYVRAFVAEEMSAEQDQNQVEVGIIVKNGKIHNIDLIQPFLGFITMLIIVLIEYGEEEILGSKKNFETIVSGGFIVELIKNGIAKLIKANDKIIRRDLFCVLSAIVKLKKEYRKSEFEIQDLQTILNGDCCFSKDYKDLYGEDCEHCVEGKCGLSEMDIRNVIALLHNHLIKQPGGYRLKNAVRCLWGLPEEDKVSR